MSGVAKVLAVTRRGSTVTVDIQDQDSASIYKRCIILGRGDGTADSSDLWAPGKDALVFYSRYASRAGVKAVVHGTLQMGSTGATRRADDKPAERDEGSGNVPGDQLGLTDWVARRAGSVFAVLADGTILLDTTKSGMPIHIQMAPGAPFRVSQGNQEPTERTLLAGPTLDTVNALTAQVNSLQAQVSALAALANLGLSAPAQVIMAGVATAKRIADQAAVVTKLANDPTAAAADKEKAAKALVDAQAAKFRADAAKLVLDSVQTPGLPTYDPTGAAASAAALASAPNMLEALGKMLVPPVDLPEAGDNHKAGAMLIPSAPAGAALVAP